MAVVVAVLRTMVYTAAMVVEAELQMELVTVPLDGVGLIQKISVVRSMHSMPVMGCVILQTYAPIVAIGLHVTSGRSEF